MSATTPRTVDDDAVPSNVTLFLDLDLDLHLEALLPAGDRDTHVVDPKVSVKVLNVDVLRSVLSSHFGRSSPNSGARLCKARVKVLAPVAVHLAMAENAKISSSGAEGPIDIGQPQPFTTTFTHDRRDSCMEPWIADGREQQEDMLKHVGSRDERAPLRVETGTPTINSRTIPRKRTSTDGCDSW
ncbi:hypothetical protein HK101_003054 [Irineochytrium annulatum]|nr:hypothetical protein HK101_003054 [Irineochytrium annulatum]